MFVEMHPDRAALAASAGRPAYFSVRSKACPPQPRRRRRPHPFERLTQAHAHLLACRLARKGMRLWQNINSKDVAKTSGCSPAGDATRPTTMSPVRPPGTFCAPTGRMPGSSRSTPTAARKQPGVLDIVTGADIVATGWKSPPVMSFFKGVGGSSLRIPFRAGLAHDRVRFVGEPVALVVAETEHHAQDAAELIAIEYEDLPVDRRGGRRHRRPAPSVFTTRCPGNLGARLRIRRSREPPSRALPTPSTSSASSFARSASPAIRWSRSPASRATTRRRSSSSSACRPRAPEI